MNRILWVNRLILSVNGRIDLIDMLYLEDGTTIDGLSNKVEISGDECFDLENNCQIMQMIFNGVTYTAITVNGDNKIIGASNVFINNYLAVHDRGNSNNIGANLFGVEGRMGWNSGSSVSGKGILGN